MKLIVPLTPDALARVDKLDAIIAKLEDNLPTLKRGERHKCQKTIKSLRHKLEEECIDALLRDGGVAPRSGRGGRGGYHVTRSEGRIDAAVWES
jgi:hypothetical protein